MKKNLPPKLITFLFLTAFFFLSVANGFAQGCVAVRPMSCASSGHSNDLSILKKGQWQVGASYRYFKSYKHFKGDVEQKQRVTDGTQVINTANSIDFGVTYGITNRLSASVNLPVSSFDRSSLYEHYGNGLNSNPDQLRFHTDSRGIGDMRLTAYYWIFNPDKDSARGNLSFGLGIKAPTGNSNVIDDFHKRTADGRDSIIRHAVDQSIQLGDGGWGMNLEVQGLYKISKNILLNVNGFYLFNPQNVNKTLTKGTLPLNYSDSLTAYHSIADQYAARIGMIWNAFPHQGIFLNLGGRIEGIPSKDIIGKSEGFRRPGYIVSVEPGVSALYRNFNFSLQVPVALYRNRTKSYSDLQLDKKYPTIDHHGDAAFADYLINVSVSYRFGKSMKHSE